MEGWENFFLGQVGASAALGGLLFVAVSLNLTRILSLPTLPDRALATLCLLLGILVVSSLMLVPGQSPVALGFEALLVGLALGAVGLRSARRRLKTTTTEDRDKARLDAILYAVCVLPYLAAGLVMIAGNLRAGLYLIAAAIVLSIVKAVLDAWVLLIEINR